MPEGLPESESCEQSAPWFSSRPRFPWPIFAGVVFKSRKYTPVELASELRALANGEMGAWDRLENVPIKDASLESMRREATAITLPLQARDSALLARLSVRAESLEYEEGG